MALTDQNKSENPSNLPLSPLRRARKNALNLMYASYGVLALAFVRCMMAGTVREGGTLLLLGIFLAMAVASVAVSAKIWKCPHCGQMLEIKRGAADKTGKCPYCKGEL